MRLILADDHRLLLEALRRSLEAGHTVVATASSGDELMAILGRHPADCLLLDLELPGRHGLQLIPVIRRRHAGLRIVVLTMYADRVLADAALASGAHAFVPKEAGLDELMVAIAEACAGRRYLSPRLSRASRRLRLEARHPALQRLTPRQQDIVLLMGEGRSATEIGQLLKVSPSTITFHKQNIMRVLGMDTPGSLIQYAVLVRSAAAPESSLARRD